MQKKKKKSFAKLYWVYFLSWQPVRKNYVGYISEYTPLLIPLLPLAMMLLHFASALFNQLFITTQYIVCCAHRISTERSSTAARRRRWSCTASRLRRVWRSTGSGETSTGPTQVHDASRCHTWTGRHDVYSSGRTSIRHRWLLIHPTG